MRAKKCRTSTSIIVADLYRRGQLDLLERKGNLWHHKIRVNKFYSVKRMRRHLYSFNSCVLYTWVLLEALNNLYELPTYKPNSLSLWFDLWPSLFLSSFLFDVVFFLCIAAIYLCVAAHGARHIWFLQLTITVLFQLFFKLEVFAFYCSDWGH